MQKLIQDSMARRIVRGSLTLSGAQLLVLQNMDPRQTRFAASTKARATWAACTGLHRGGETSPSSLPICSPKRGSLRGPRISDGRAMVTDLKPSAVMAASTSPFTRL